MPPCDHNPPAARTVVRLLGACLVPLAVLCFAPAAHALDSGDIVVVSLRGEVQVTMGGVERAVHAGAALALPATVRTGRDGAIELRQGATSVNVGPDTQLEFPALEVPGGPIDRIQQPRGNAFYDVGKRGSRKLRVETPFLVAVVKGTQFNVAAREDATTIALFEGQLEIRSADETDVVDIVAGEIASRHRSEQEIGVIRMDESRSVPAPAAPPGAEGGEHTAPAPRAEPVEEGDAYLVHEESVADGTTDFALADARIDLGATDTLTASLVNPGIPGAGAGAGAGSGADESPGPGPVIDTGSNAPPDPIEATPPVSDPGPVPGDVGTGGGVSVDVGTPDAGVSVGVGNGQVNVDVDVGVEVPVAGPDVGADVDLGVDLNGDNNSGSGNGNGNAHGHDKDNANGEANGHDKDDGDGLVGELVEDVVGLLESALRKPDKR